MITILRKVKPKIALIVDVENWGPWYRAKYIKKHLSDEFDFSIFLLKNFKYGENRDFEIYYPLLHTMLINGRIQNEIPSTSKIITCVTGLPVIKKAFGNEPSEARRKWNMLSSRCSAIMANNLYSLRELRRVFSGDSYYTTRGVDEKIFRKTKDIQKDDILRIGFVGKPVREKGIFFLRNVAKDASSFKLLQNNRNFTNALSPEEMNEFYNEMDVYAVASSIDGTPNPALEAAACGRPIISNKIGNMPEFIEDGWNGFLLEKNGKKAYRKAFEFCRDNKDEVRRMGNNARKTVLDKWTWKKVLERERKIFRNVVNKGVFI